MAHIPTLEEILSEVHSRLGLEALPNKNRFINCELELSSHVERIQSLLSDIFNTFLLDKRAREDLARVILPLSGALKTIELHTWTGNASQQQVLWATLVRVFIPISARHLASWNLGNIELGLPPCDAGMPGGEFWFLPTSDFKSGTIDLPVPKVLNWLLDLLNCPSTEDLSNSIGNKQLRESEGGNEAAVRTLRNWQSGKLPKSQQKIEEIFPDDAQLVFAGAFQLDTTLTLETQFENAFKFATQHKKLDLEQLHKQIPMNPARLERVFNGTASDEEKSDFVRQICIRYAAPDMAVIRQRLQIARLFQAGYQDLLKFLCPEVTPAVEHDPQKNKLLQLIYFFQEIYNKTTDALNHGDNNPDQDAWFLKQFHPIEQYDLLLFINTEIEGDDRVKILAERLTRLFLSLDPEHGLENIYAKDTDDIKNSLVPRWKRIQQEFEEDKQIKILLERVKAASPYRTIQSESNFQVLIQFAQFRKLNEKIRRMAYERLATIAKSPLERGSLTLLELGELLNGVQNTWPKDICAKVQKLLDSAEADKAVWELWKAPLLRFKAKHALFQNQHAAAEKLFKAALDACSERAFGGLRGEIAFDGFAVAIQRSGLNRKNHEPFYRNYLLYSEFKNGIPSFEDAATECEEFYWSELYQPYPDFKVEENISLDIFLEIVIPVINSDWDNVKKWLTKNEKTLRNRDFKDVRRQSALMLSLKILFRLKDNAQSLLPFFPKNLRSTAIKNWREFVSILLNTWPEQAKIGDFKMQTPLMLAANQGDYEIVKLLVPISEINAQDYLGRTPLHAAVAGRSIFCLQEILKMSPECQKVTEYESHTAMHTAVRFGWIDGVRQILAEIPETAFIKNNFGQSPLDIAREILENHSEWCAYMEKKGRSTGKKEDFEIIYDMLNKHCMQMKSPA